MADRGQLVRAAGRVALVERGEQRAGRPHVARSAASQALQTRSRPASSSPANAGSTPSSSSSARRTPKSKHSRQASGVEARELAAVEHERRARPVRAVRALADDAVAERVVAGDLEREAQRLAAARRCDERRVRARLARRCSGPARRARPTHSVASLRVSASRSTRAPAHAGGTVAATRSQYVANSGPSSAPSATGA